jgi:fructose-1,6-bisphosphatase/inositol monophosphatase family enzyme
MHADLQVAIQAAKEAGEIICRGYSQRCKCDAKGIGDLVCSIDKEADAAILARLRTHFPEDSVCSEELNPDVKCRSGRVWIVDPLDGTAGFLFHAGKQIPAVLVALQEEGVTRVGVVYIPVTDELFYAVQGQGAYKGDTPLNVKSVPQTLSAAWVDMNQYGDASFESEPFRLLRDRLRMKGGACIVTTSMPHSGSAMRVLECETDLAVVIHDNNSSNVKQAAWDVAAPQLIVQEAGGGFWNMKGETYDPFAAEPFIVAASKELADQVIALL